MPKHALFPTEDHIIHRNIVVDAPFISERIERQAGDFFSNYAVSAQGTGQFRWSDKLPPIVGPAREPSHDVLCSNYAKSK